MSASRSSRGTTIAATVAGLIAAPLAVVGASAPAHAAPVQIQILGTNDFHGRLLPNRAEAGAAQFAGAVAQLEADNPNTVFAAAGDLIGASTFESFIQKDKPTLDALNAAGLDVSAAGNHEFDAGYDDLVNRVMAPFDATTNEFGGAEWQYLAANVRKRSDNTYALPDVTPQTPDPADTSDGGTWMTTIGGVKVGFVGTVTEELSSLVSPAGIADVAVTDIVQETNAAADDLKADGADIVIMLIHEGATTTNIASVTDDSVFGRIVAGVDSDVSAIISGHTHLAYNHVVDGRPVVSSGQYGTNLNKLLFTVDPETNSVTFDGSSIVAAATLPLTAQSAIDKKAEVQSIVDAAVAEADVLGAQVLGELEDPFYRAAVAGDGPGSNRGAESTLGNLVAEVQRWATETPEAGGAQIAFMNPGGLRDDMLGNNADGYPAVLTYKQAAVVQPFANTLVNMSMTGAQIKTVLEQQWQRGDDGQIPSRPFLRLGTSEGFTFTYDPARPEGDRITGMWLHGTPIGATTSYSVTANSFLAAGGDNFRGFNAATGKRDTGKIDLQAMVDYAAAQSPVAADETQHAVGISRPAGAPAEYAYGDHINLSVSSWAFTAPTDVKDTEIEVRMGDNVLGTFPVDNTLSTEPFDESGKASIDVVVPTSVSPGTRRLTLVGNKTGTRAFVPVTVAKQASTVKATIDPATVKFKKGTSEIAVQVTSAGTPTGAVTAILDGKVIGAGELSGGKATIEVGPFEEVGTKKITVKYYGDDLTKAGSTTVSLDVQRARPRLKVRAPKHAERGDRIKVRVRVTADGVTATGKVTLRVAGKKVIKRVKDGRVTLRVRMTKLGKHTIKVRYRGDENLTAVTKKVSIRVARR